MIFKARIIILAEVMPYAAPCQEGHLPPRPNMRHRPRDVPGGHAGAGGSHPGADTGAGQGNEGPNEELSDAKQIRSRCYCWMEFDVGEQYPVGMEFSLTEAWMCTAPCQQVNTPGRNLWAQTNNYYKKNREGLLLANL